MKQRDHDLSFTRIRISTKKRNFLAKYGAAYPSCNGVTRATLRLYNFIFCETTRFYFVSK